MASVETLASKGILTVLALRSFAGFLGEPRFLAGERLKGLKSSSSLVAGDDAAGSVDT